MTPPTRLKGSHCLKIIIMKKIVSVLFVCLFVNLLYAQSVQTEKLDSYFKILEDNNKFMGSVSVFSKGKEIYTKTVGYSDVDAKIKADKNSKYNIGSISKTFTAVMVFKAIESGKLSLDQTLDKFFPAIINADKIKISHLLQHRSGIRNFTQDNDFSTWNSESKTQQEMLKIIEKSGSDFSPDSKMAYSNSNYVLLSYILEHLYKQPYDKILNREIIQPLALKNTHFGESGDFNYCKSFKYIDKWRVESQTNPSITMGAGGIISTPYDMNVFGEALFSGKLLSQNSLMQMMSLRDNIGMGLFVFPFYERQGFGHTGGIDGFNSVFIYFPSDQISYSIVSNGLNYILNNVSLAVLCGVYNKPFDLPDFGVVDLTSEELNKYLGVYSSSQLPIKLTITKNGKTLVAQGTGQAPFNLDATSKDIFRFEQAGIVIEFKPAENILVLKQGGGVYILKREL